MYFSSTSRKPSIGGGHFKSPPSITGLIGGGLMFPVYTSKSAVYDHPQTTCRFLEGIDGEPSKFAVYGVNYRRRTQVRRLYEGIGGEPCKFRGL